MSVNHSTRSGGHKRDIFSVFSNVKVCCMFSLESPHRSDSNEYTPNTIFSIKTKNDLKFFPNLQLWDFSKGPKNKFEAAAVNESSVFKPLKVYRTFLAHHC